MSHHVSRLLVAIAVSVVSTTAFADHSSVAAAERDDYVDGKLILGYEELPGIASMLIVAAGLEVGRRLTRHLWVHGALGSGTAASFDRYHGDYLAAQAGIEGRVCTSTDVVCATGAVDAAAIHITQVYDPVHTGIDYTAPGGFLCAGVDVGGNRLRARLSLETGHALSHAGFVADLSLGVSVRF
jgi:hypothetical protein